VSALISALHGLVRTTFRLLVPEGLLLALLLGLPTAVPLAVIAPYVPLVAGVTVLGALGVGWRFRRGRMVYGVVLVGSAALVPWLPPGVQALAAALIPLNLALLAVLPERGVVSGPGLVLGTGILAETGLLIWLAFGYGAPAPPHDLLLPGVPPLSLFQLGAGLGLATLALVALGHDDALRRGLFWATAAGVAAQVGLPASLGWPSGWVLLAAVLVLAVAAVEEAHRMAYQDALTGLPSRRALDERLDRISGRYTVAMVDVDHFKRFNDRHGHDVGDQVLRMVAARLAETPGARAYRYGGEEFTLLFRGRSLDDVRDRLEEVRGRIADRPFVLRGSDRPSEKPKRTLFLWRPRQELAVTVSVGAATRTAWRQPPEEVIRAADEALYRAKKRGRNRVVA
jgi:diguanylate cyclase (GGDEF)-like protein